MRTHRALLRSSLFGIALIALVTLAHDVAQAEPINFQGNATGCFNCGTGGPFSSSILHIQLHYVGSTFDVTTNSLGNASIGNSPVLFAPNFNNLGSFQLSAFSAIYDNSTFTLRVNFTAPSGAESPIITADVTGQVEQFAGNLIVDFDNAFQTFSLPNGGSFQFRLNDISVTPGRIVPLTGDILNATSEPVPEPVTLLLLGTGLSGIAIKLRRKKKARS